jgi:hypothetical protein
MSNPAGTAAPVTPTDEFVALMVATHAEGVTVREAHDLERRARMIAKQHGLDEFALEPTVLAQVYRGMDDEALERAARFPERRGYARAEQRRRAEVATALEIDPEATAPVVDLGVVCALLNGNPNVTARVWVTSLGGGLAALVVNRHGSENTGAHVCIDEAPRVFDTAEHGPARLMGLEPETETNGGERSWQIGHASTSLDAARLIAREYGLGF